MWGHWQTETACHFGHLACCVWNIGHVLDGRHCVLGCLSGSVFLLLLHIKFVGDFDPSRHLCPSDFTFNTEGAILTIGWSKTIQFQERVVLVPIPRIPHSVFCPSQAAILAFRIVPAITDPSPAFMTPSQGVQPVNPGIVCIPPKVVSSEDRTGSV
jgi:hypothetical protein